MRQALLLAGVTAIFAGLCALPAAAFTPEKVVETIVVSEDESETSHTAIEPSRDTYLVISGVVSVTKEGSTGKFDAFWFLGDGSKCGPVSAEFLKISSAAGSVTHNVGPISHAFPCTSSHTYRVKVGGPNAFVQAKGPVTVKADVWDDSIGTTPSYSGAFTVKIVEGAAGGGGRPALPDPFVELESVSNGCGGGLASNEPKFADTSTYPDSGSGTGAVLITVNFRLACDLHDAGYSGAKVADPFSGGKAIDFFTWTQKQIDDKFLKDLRTLCKAQIPAERTGALEHCLGTGSATNFGAESRYNFVRRFGHNFYRARPRLTGTWANPDRRSVPSWPVKQTVREVSGKWRSASGSETYEFYGRIVSYDQNSKVHGFVKSTDPAKTKWVSMTWTIGGNPKEFECEVKGKDLYGCATVRDRV